MKRYCERCRDFHDENELCPIYKEQLKKHPEWVAEATQMASQACQNYLITSQALDKAAQGVNKILNTNLSYEGTQQIARDIQVFKKLNTDSFRNAGTFQNAETAKAAWENGGDGFRQYVRSRLNGTGQEVDWQRLREGNLKSIFEKASLPDGNVPGYDGIVENRFTGKVVERVTVKSAQGSSGLYTNAKDIVEAIEKGTLSPNDSAFVTKGTAEKFNKIIDQRISEIGDSNPELVERLKSAKDNLDFTEHGTTTTATESTDRLVEKIKNGEAHTSITGEMVAKKMASGAAIGAAVSLTVSGLTNFIRYKNGEITQKEAFRDIGEDTIKGALVGGAMGGITLFLPGGIIGFAAGMAISIYINEVCGNLLDEVFGKGAYEQILHASGYVAGTAQSLVEVLEKHKKNIETMENSTKQAKLKMSRTEKNLEATEANISKITSMLEDL